MSVRLATSTARLLRSSSRLTALNTQLKPRNLPGAARVMASNALPKTMAGVIIEKTGGTEVLQYKTDLPVPSPGQDEVLIKNEYIGVNYIDTYFRTGLYPAPKMPYMLGRESAGSILALGSGQMHGLREGDRVVVLAQATYAQYTAAPTAHCIRVPDGISTQDAAAALLQGLTALTLIRESYHVRRGDWILVHAAAGGVGLWLLQLLRAVGARVVATCSTPKVELVRRYGAERVVDYTAVGVEGVVKEVLDATAGEGCAAVFDGVGKATFDASLECLARKGTLASFGNASGAVPPFAIARLSAKNAKVLRPTLFNYIATRQEFEEYANELFDFMLQDKMDVNIHEVYPLKDVARAHEDLEGRKTTGKLLLKP